MKLATNRPDGLEECTREMFSLAMLVRLGRITENDVRATFAAFRRLDVGNYGTLNSRTIIEGELMRRKSLRNLAALSQPEERWGQQQQQQQQQQHDNTQQYQLHGPYISENNVASRAPGPVHHRTATPIHHGSPNPYMNNGSPLVRRESAGSYYSQHSRTSSIDYNEYEHWQNSFSYYSSPTSRTNKRGPNLKPFT